MFTILRRPSPGAHLHAALRHRAGRQLRCLGCPTPVIEPKVTRISVEDFATSLANIDVEKVNMLRLNPTDSVATQAARRDRRRDSEAARQGLNRLEISTNGQWGRLGRFEDAMRLEVVNKLVVSCDEMDARRLRAASPPLQMGQAHRVSRRAEGYPGPVRRRRCSFARAASFARARMRALEEVLRPRGWLPSLQRHCVRPRRISRDARSSRLAATASTWPTRRSSSTTRGSGNEPALRGCRRIRRARCPSTRTRKCWATFAPSATATFSRERAGVA